MGFCGIGELGASVDIVLASDAIAALADIRKVQVEGVTVHEVMIAFGDADLIAQIKAPLAGRNGVHPTMLIATWVNEVAKKPYVAKTTTRVIVHDPEHSKHRHAG